MQDLYGTVVVITGASSGAGRAIANEFAATGATLVLASRREQSLREVAEECRSLGAVVHEVITDVRRGTDVAKLARSASELTGKIDIWINNAGVLAAGGFDDIPEEVNTNVVLTNLMGYMHGAQYALPYFKQQGYGMLFNNISVGGWFATPYAAAYTASKFGIRGFSESLKAELHDYPDIHIIDLYPGFLDTPGIQHAANYTGKTLMPAPPVYDPRKLARAILRLVRYPVQKKTVGAASAFLRIAYATFPGLSRTITSAVMRGYFKKAKPISETPGNVLFPVEYGNSIYGGWSRKLTPKPRTFAIAGAALVGLIFLASCLKGEK